MSNIRKVLNPLRRYGVGKIIQYSNIFLREEIAHSAHFHGSMLTKSKNLNKYMITQTSAAALNYNMIMNLFLSPSKTILNFSKNIICIRRYAPYFNNVNVLLILSYFMQSRTGNSNNDGTALCYHC